MVVKQKERHEPAPTAVTRRRFTTDEYVRLAEAGILGEDERIELLDGEIVCMAAISAGHSACVSRLQYWFVGRLLGRALVRIQDAIGLSAHSQPEPDVALVRWRNDHYVDAQPGPRDVLLLIEVAISSLRSDRERKLPLYAAARIPEVWLVDLDGARVLVYRAPRGRRYMQTTVIERGGTLTPLAFPDLTLTLDDLLGQAA